MSDEVDYEALRQAYLLLKETRAKHNHKNKWFDDICETIDKERDGYPTPRQMVVLRNIWEEYEEQKQLVDTVLAMHDKVKKSAFLRDVTKQFYDRGSLSLKQVACLRKVIEF